MLRVFKFCLLKTANIKTCRIRSEMSNHMQKSATMATLILTALFLQLVKGEIGEKHLKKPLHCPGQVIAESHRYQTLGARSVLECLSLCRPEVSCLSIVVSTRDRKCFLGNALASQTCSNMVPGDEDMVYFEIENHCDRTREIMAPDGLCVCAEGFRGHPCQPYVGDCTEGFQKGNFSADGIYLIHPLQAPAPFPVYCRDQPGFNQRTYIMERKDNLNFNRNFSDYKAGFGSLTGSHWLGLERVVQLSNSKPYELRIAFKLNNSTIVFMQYQIFRVSGADSGYELFCNQTTNETYLLGDCFSPLYGARFSAYDNDNDEDDTVNCAAKHQGGWWFRGSSCSTCNPTGPLLKPADGLLTGVDEEAFWKEDMGNLAAYRLSMFLVVL